MAMLRGCFLEFVNCACYRLGVLQHLGSGLSTTSSEFCRQPPRQPRASLSCFSNLKGSQQLTIGRRRHIWELLLQRSDLAVESRTPATAEPSATINTPEHAWASRRTCPGRAKSREGKKQIHSPRCRRKQQSSSSRRVTEEQIPIV